MIVHIFQMMKFFMFCTLILFLPIVYSVDYCMDEDVTIDKSGLVTIKGSTNLPILNDLANEAININTNELTSKKGKYWLFEYSSKENVSAIFLRLNLPQGSIINHIKSDQTIGITTENDHIIITFASVDKPLSIIVQYHIVGQKSINYFPWVIAVIILIVILATIISLSRQSKINKLKLNTIKSTLNEAQIKIIDALLEKKGQASQTAIGYMTGLPKSSLSRNIELLSQKEIIQKFYNGTINYLKVHPSYIK